MFQGDTAFNGNIANWNTNSVTTMAYMFDGDTAFNQNIGSWNTIKVTTMYGMFYQDTAFNQNIGSWNTNSVTTMYGMFYQDTAFNQNIGSWNTMLVTNALSMFTGVTLSDSNYDKLLNGWGSRTENILVPFGGGNSKYTSVGLVGRNILTNTIVNSGYEWNIIDGGQDFNVIVANPNPYTLSSTAIGISQTSVANTAISGGKSTTTGYTGQWFWSPPASSNIIAGNTIVASLPHSNNALTLTITVMLANEVQVTFNSITYNIIAPGANTIGGNWIFNATVGDAGGDSSPSHALTNTILISTGSSYTPPTVSQLLISNMVVDVGQTQVVTAYVYNGISPYTYNTNVFTYSIPAVANMLAVNSLTGNAFSYKQLSAWGYDESFWVNITIADNSGTYATTAIPFSSAGTTSSTASIALSTTGGSPNLWLCGAAEGGQSLDTETSIQTNFVQDANDGDYYVAAVGHNSANDCGASDPDSSQGPFAAVALGLATNTLNPPYILADSKSSGSQTNQEVMSFTTVANSFAVMIITCGSGSNGDDAGRGACDGSYGNVVLSSGLSGCINQATEDYDGGETATLYTCNSLPAGSYTATVNDNTGYTDMATAAYAFYNSTYQTTYQVHSQLASTSISSPLAANTLDNGQHLTVSVTAPTTGASPYAYSWASVGSCPTFTSANTQSFTYNPTTGTTANCQFTVTVTDSATTNEVYSAATPIITVNTAQTPPTMIITPSNSVQQTNPQSIMVTANIITDSTNIIVNNVQVAIGLYESTYSYTFNQGNYSIEGCDTSSGLCVYNEIVITAPISGSGGGGYQSTTSKSTTSLTTTTVPPTTAVGVLGSAWQIAGNTWTAFTAWIKPVYAMTFIQIPDWILASVALMVITIVVRNEKKDSRAYWVPALASIVVVALYFIA